MDWSSVILAAIGGGVGAGLGGLLLAILWPRKTPANGAGRKLDLRGIVLIILVVLGSRLGQPLLDPIIGPAVRDWVGTDFEGEIVEMMASEPFFQVLQEKAPERADAWRIAVAEAYRAGGEAEAARVARAEGEVIGAWMVAEFSPRATDEALLGFYAALSAVTRGTLMDHPRECYGFYLPNQFPGSPSSPDLETMGIDAMEIGRHMIALAQTASDEPVEVNAAAAAAAQEAAVMAASEVMGADNLILLGGRLPETDAEYRLVCQGMLAFFEHIQASDDPANTFRVMAAGG